jgi:hypothetical protein
MGRLRSRSSVELAAEERKAILQRGRYLVQAWAVRRSQLAGMLPSDPRKDVASAGTQDARQLPSVGGSVPTVERVEAPHIDRPTEGG